VVSFHGAFFLSARCRESACMSGEYLTEEANRHLIVISIRPVLDGTIILYPGCMIQSERPIIVPARSYRLNALSRALLPIVILLFSSASRIKSLLPFHQRHGYDQHLCSTRVCIMSKLNGFTQQTLTYTGCSIYNNRLFTGVDLER
jgi:hypothetical protein